jgi:hypothetical protein
MLAGLAEIEARVREMVALIDAMSGERPDRAGDAADAPP